MDGERQAPTADPVAATETLELIDSAVGQQHEAVTTVAFVDVGQGDCTIVAPSSAPGILIDCPDKGIADAISALNRLEITHLTLAFITHWDADHFGGVLTVASAFGCNEIRYNHDTLIADTDTPKQLRLAILLRLLSSEFAEVALASAVSGQSGTVGNAMYFSMIGVRDGVSSGSVTV